MHLLECFHVAGRLWPSTEFWSCRTLLQLLYRRFSLAHGLFESSACLLVKLINVGDWSDGAKNVCLLDYLLREWVRVILGSYSRDDWIGLKVLVIDLSFRILLQSKGLRQSERAFTRSSDTSVCEEILVRLIRLSTIPEVWSCVICRIPGSSARQELLDS